ncbi:hypothetical protein WBK31_35630 [Nonomuraea sp. N2-4H]|uniref:hypothetical protein n=1 Tax=Nonomuraea sp. N2-4H TaxID=3128898 RepID=UPI00324D0D1E
MSTSYPIIEEQDLPPSQRRFGIFARRDPAQLPQPRAGTVLVFEVHGGHHAFAERGHPRGTEEAVVEARSVAVVDVRARHVSAEVELPSRDLGYKFTVRANFRCRVTNPETVVADHVKDVAEILAGHLRKDSTLMQLGATRPIEDVNALAPDVVSRVQAFLEFHPPVIDGMEIALENVELLMPDDVAVHGRGLKRIQWGGESAELRAAIENRDVERIESILQRGVEAATALGISREQIMMNDVVQASRALHKERLQRLQKVLDSLPEGSLDFLPIDSQQLLSKVMKAMAGFEPFDEVPGSEERPALPDGRDRGETDGPRSIGLEDLDD